MASVTAMEASLVAMESTLAAMVATLPAMEATLQELDATFAAMKAAQAGNCCPSGFDENLFRVLCEQAADKADFQKRIDDQRQDIRDQQKRIDDQRKRIDDQRKRIDDQQKRIDDQQKQIRDHQGGIRDQRKRTDKDDQESETDTQSTHLQPVPKEADEVISPQFTLKARRMWFACLKLNNISGTRIKARIHAKACAASVGGYVQRTGANTFSVCAVSPDYEDCQAFITALVEQYGSGQITVLKTSHERNDKLAQIFHQGFKKVKNSMMPSGTSSTELTPDEDSDMVSVSVSSELWQ